MILFFKTSHLNEEVNCNEPSPSISIPCLVFTAENWLKPLLHKIPILTNLTFLQSQLCKIAARLEFKICKKILTDFGKLNFADFRSNLSQYYKKFFEVDLLTFL